MDKDVVLNKLESLRRCIRRVEDKTPVSVDLLVEDYDLQDIISVKGSYDFASLSGRLKWSGNAVEEQRKLRDEW